MEPVTIASIIAILLPAILQILKGIFGTNEPQKHEVKDAPATVEDSSDADRLADLDRLFSHPRPADKN